MGQLVFQATLGGQVNLVGPNTASTFNINVPATAGTMVTTGDTGTVSSTMLASGLTLAGSVTYSGGTANGVAYLNGSKVLTTGTALVFDGSNLGLGVTPSAWASGFRALQVKNASLWSTGNDASLTANAYYDGTNYKYIGTNGASRQYHNTDGSIAWSLAASGTAGNAISFTQAMTLTAVGDLCVGATSTALNNGGFAVLPAGNAANNPFVNLGHANGSASGSFYYLFQYNGTTIGSITQSGTTATLFNVTSDQRLKENIADAASASALIDSIQVRQYDWKADGSHQRYGFVAQELVTVAPEAVHQPADPEAMMAVDYSKLVPMLVKEIQSLRQRVASLEA